MKTDAQLQRDVVAELQWEPSIDATQIGVTVKDGVVALNGYVPVYAHKFKAEAVAKGVHGVKAIANDLEVRLPGSGQRTDADIAAAVVHTLKWDAAVPEDRIQVTVRDGWITLDGTVDWQYQKETADRAVRSLIGARGVTDSILVKSQGEPHLEPMEIKAGIEAAFVRSATLDSFGIQVETHGRTVILRGEVHSHMEREDAERVAWAAPSISRVENYLTVTPWRD